MNKSLITVFGGTGFLGQRLVAKLLQSGHPVRLVARHPERACFTADEERLLVRFPADITRRHQVAEASAGSRVIVNVVSLYEERGGLDFDAVHVLAAGQLAGLARRAGVDRLVHISGIGADSHSPSAYVRARARGERAVRDAFPGSVIARPSALFGRNDALLSALIRLARLPIVPMFGRGNTRLQPVWVDDLAHGLALLATSCAQPELLYELGGGQVYRYREMLQLVQAHLGCRGLLLPVPFPIWRGLSSIMHRLPGETLLTRDQVLLMERDNIASGKTDTFEDLGVQPVSLEDFLEKRL